MKPLPYRLLDFGEGRKLEAIGDYRIVRPSPAARDARRSDAWNDIDAEFDDIDRVWKFNRRWPADLRVDCGDFHMPASPTPFGHIGLFPEQRQRWRELVSRHPLAPESAALNLFAYTGAATIALAKAGYRVVHVDAARPNVAAARAAAKQNGLSEHPIRWLVDDAVKFVARETRRGNRYEVLVLDPPAYGHGPAGKAWRLERDLWPLLDASLSLLSMPGGILVSGHSADMDHRDLRRWFEKNGPKIRPEIPWTDACYDGRRLRIPCVDGRHLDAGYSLFLHLRDS